MIAGHTRCLVDVCFGLFKRLYRRSDTDTVAQVADVVERSISVNLAQLFADAEMPVHYYEWDTFQLQYFRPLKGNSNMPHFEFDGSKPGVLMSKQTLASPSVQADLFQKDVNKAVVVGGGQPPVLVPGGLSQERKTYLSKSVRENFHEDFRGEICPDPASYNQAN